MARTPFSLLTLNDFGFNLEEFTLGILKDGKQPTDFPRVEPIESLEEILPHTLLIFVERGASSVSAKIVDAPFPIPGPKTPTEVGIALGYCEHGMYHTEKETFFAFPAYEISPRTDQEVVTKEKLSEGEVYKVYI